MRGGVAAADELGLSRDAVYELLATTPVAAQAERRRPAIERNEYPPRFRLALAQKDAVLLAKAADGVDMRVFRAVRSWLSDAAAAGRGELDYSAMLAQIIETSARIR